VSDETMIAFERVCIVFGDAPQRALPLMDEGRTRPEIQEATGQILGVHDCSLQVRRGEISVLMGLSGSGKSTLLRAVNGLNPVTRGAVRVRGRDGDRVDVVTCAPSALRALRRGGVSMVFQNFALLPWRSVVENVALGLELSRTVPASRRRARCSRPSASTTGPRSASPSSRAACSSASAWRAPSPPTPRSCSWTSRSPPSTR
jgi:glycine betaine/proline transport system ATP-binding protein